MSAFGSHPHLCLLPDYQHRHASVRQDLRCLTPQQQLPEAATPMRGHDDQVAASGLCCFDNCRGWVRIRYMQEFCGYPDRLRHSSSSIEHIARTFPAGCVKPITRFLRGNPSRVEAATVVELQRCRDGDDCRFRVQGLCQSNPMLNAFSRDIRSIRAQEDIGVHWGTPLLVEHYDRG